jgi:hypothetical protein
VQRVDVVYAVHRLDVPRVLDAVYREPPGWQPQWQRKVATERQINWLGQPGFYVPDDLNHKQASALSEIIAQRRAAGLLCTVKQGRRLRPTRCVMT